MFMKRSGTGAPTTGGAPDREEARASAEAPFLPLSSLRRNARDWAGLACLFSWMDLLLCFEGALRDTEVEQGGLVHDPFFFGATLAAGVALVMAAALRGRLAGRPARRPGRPSRAPAAVSLAVPAALGATCSAAAAALAALSPAVAPALSAALGVGAGLAAARLTLSWGRALAALDLRETLLAVFPAACLQWAPLALLDFLPAAARLALVGLLPVLSAACLAPASCSGAVPQGAAPKREQARGRAAAGADDEPPRPGAARPTPIGTVARMGAMALLFFCVIQLMWCFFIKVLVNRLDPSLFRVVFLLAMAACAVVLGLCVAAMQRQRAYRLELFYRTMFVACLVGVVACAMAPGGDGAGWVLPSYVLIYTGYSLAGPIVWLLALGCVYMGGHHPTDVVGSVVGCQYLGMFLGMAVVVAMDAGEGAASGASALPAAMLACTVALALAYVAVFPERSLLALSPLLFGASRDALEERCQRLADRCGLTPREAQVLALLARGRDAAYIAGELFISRNTASAHRKSIYAKLGVHSQQELMTLVEGGQG